MDSSELSAAVDQAFLVTSAGLPHWPDPRPDGRPPSDEEYSRCVDPGKYRLLLARAEAWATALGDLGLGAARETPAAPQWQVHGRRPVSRAVLVEPHAEGAVPLLFVHWDRDADFVPMVEVRVGPSGVPVVRAPDCGCDACDDGSASQLAALDAAIAPVVTGEWLHIAAPGLSIVATAHRWSAHGRRNNQDIGRLVEEARAGRSPHPVVRAAPWW